MTCPTKARSSTVNLPSDWRQRASLTIAQAAQLLSVRPEYVYRLSYRGDIRTVKLGGRRVVPVSSLLELIEGGDRVPRRGGAR